ncbi:carbamoyltransferase HypF [Roseibium sp. M-1]
MPDTSLSITARSIRINGLVQGVGFRPFVWTLANELGLCGTVRNDGAGVLIEVQGPAHALERFLDGLCQQTPVLARIKKVEITDLPVTGSDEGFRILTSGQGPVATGVVPDAATCPACLADIRNPADRRQSYAFTNCTHCGPRLSILRHIPYDRASTSMAAFQMCAVCEEEYEDPADRRFHAQPVACPECGPRLWFEEADGHRMSGNPVKLATARLKAGAILAIKGLGGFQIAVDASNEAAVAELRRRKHRPAKPLALMAGDVDQIRQYARVSEAEAELLKSPAAPIVLLRKSGPELSESVAGGFDRLGFMLPNTPLHHLLMAELDGPIVLTSGNLSDNPQETDNAAARLNLAGIVDGFLMHDREILNRLDDSVVRIDRAGPAILRRARGYAPAPVRLKVEFETAPRILALGGELKSAFCLLNGRDAILSQHIGDLENAPTLADYRKMLRFYLDLFQFKPELVAVDAHPQYLSTQLGDQLAREMDVPLMRVQHHHAHLGACLAEQGSEMGGEVFGIILDGLGWGVDGTGWGGEIVKGGLRGFERVGHFQPVALPGGAAAIREPWRNLAAQLLAAFGPDYREQLVGTGLEVRFAGRSSTMLDEMIAKGINAPLSSSAGRLFDAVAAALGLCPDRQNFEGEAAMRLEALAAAALGDEVGYPLDVTQSPAAVLSFRSLWTALLRDLRAGVPAEIISARFHLGLIDSLVRALPVAGAKTSDAVALSGGVFQNAVLRDGLTERLEAEGFRVLNHRQVPANDGGLAIGQAVIAAVQAESRTLSN